MSHAQSWKSILKDPYVQGLERRLLGRRQVKDEVSEAARGQIISSRSLNFILSVLSDLRW